MAPADPEYRAFSSRRATEILVPPGAKSGRKAVAKLSDCAQRGLHTHPRRTNSKLRQTRRTRQAVAPDSESNTKGSVPCGLRGQRGRLSAPPPKYRTGRRDSESPPLPTIFVAGAPRAQSMTRTAFFSLKTAPETPIRRFREIQENCDSGNPRCSGESGGAQRFSCQIRAMGYIVTTWLRFLDATMQSVVDSKRAVRSLGS
jgi:hypothetical protein